MCSISRSTISVRIDRTSPATGGAWPHSSRLRGIRNSPRCEVANPASRSLRGRYFQSFLPGGSVAQGEGGLHPSVASLSGIWSEYRANSGELAVYTYKCIIQPVSTLHYRLTTPNCLRRTVVILTDGQKESCRRIKRNYDSCLYFIQPCEWLKSGLLKHHSDDGKTSSIAFSFSFFDNLGSYICSSIRH